MGSPLCRWLLAVVGCLGYAREECGSGRARRPTLRPAHQSGPALTPFAGGRGSTRRAGTWSIGTPKRWASPASVASATARNGSAGISSARAKRSARPWSNGPGSSPGGDLEGVQRQRACEAHQRVTLLQLRQPEQRRVEVDLVRPGQGDRPALIEDQLHAPSRACGRDPHPMFVWPTRVGAPSRAAFQRLSRSEAAAVRVDQPPPGERQTPGASYPLTTPIGRSRATRTARPARSTIPTTRSTSL
jgi:hypothetical protein